MHENPNITYKTYLSLLHGRVPFALSRWGDGEWLATLGTGQNQKANADGTQYTKSLQKALRLVLKSPHNHPYFHGILNIAKSHLEPRILNWLRREESQIVWVDGDALLDASLEGDLAPFVEEVRSFRRIGYVGPDKIRTAVLEFFPDACFVPVPEAVAFDTWRETVAAIRSADFNIVLFSAGMASNVMMHHLWEQTAGRVFLIDCGSMFDGHAGLSSRSYIARYDWDRLFEVNTGKRAKAKGEIFRK